jgi:cytochrome d ubiquinol oxidase subunit II
MNEYEIFRLIWWALLGLLLIGLAVMDGFDLGAAMLMPVIGRTDAQRRVVINTIGPVWEGNQVWLVLGAGAIFAAWPMLYAVAFSGFYFAMLLLLFSLFLRPVGFTYRSKLKHPRWRNFWDGALFIGGLVPALVYGVAFGNVLQGVPFSFDDSLRMTYTGTFLALFNPFALLCGVISVVMLVMHGAAYIACKTEGVIRARARRAGAGAAITLAALTAGAGLWAVAFVAAAITAALCFTEKFAALTFITSGVAIAGVIGTAGVSLFPFMLPSSSAPNDSLMIWDTSSSLLTLQIMLGATVIFLPLILLYTSWVYYMLRGPVTVASIERDDHTAY